MDFPLKIVTMDGVFFDGKAERVTVRTTAGDVSILARHIDYVSPLGVGVCKILFEGNVRRAASSGGFISMKNGSCVICATTFEWEDSIDLERAKKAKAVAEERIKQKLSEKEAIAAEMKLKRALNRINTASKE